jgi:hypothetical protein
MFTTLPRFLNQPFPLCWVWVPWLFAGALPKTGVPDTSVTFKMSQQPFTNTEILACNQNSSKPPQKNNQNNQKNNQKQAIRSVCGFNPPQTPQ